MAMKPAVRNCLAWFSGVYLSKTINLFQDSIYRPAFQTRTYSKEEGDYIITYQYLHPSGFQNQVILHIIFFAGAFLIGFVMSTLATPKARKLFLLIGALGAAIIGYLTSVRNTGDLLFTGSLVLNQTIGYILGSLLAIKLFKEKAELIRL
jgi:hypothetical protein